MKTIAQNMNITLLMLCSVILSSVSAAQQETYLLPSFIEAEFDTNIRTGWRQCLLPASSTAKHHRPAWRMFSTREDAEAAINSHPRYQYVHGRAHSINATPYKAIAQYGTMIEQDYEEAQKQFNRVSKDRRACYGKLALLGMCTSICGLIGYLSTSNTYGKAGSALFGLHGFYSFWRNLKNFFSVWQNDDPRDMAATLKNDFYRHKTELRGKLWEQGLNCETGIGKYGLYLHRL